MGLIGRLLGKEKKELTSKIVNELKGLQQNVEKLGGRIDGETLKILKLRIDTLEINYDISAPLAIYDEFKHRYDAQQEAQKAI